MSIREKQVGGIAWVVIVAIATVYEFMFEDLLSMATERWCKRHPIWGRAVILAVAFHLACVMPSIFDVFSHKNLFRRFVVYIIGHQRGGRNAKTEDVLYGKLQGVQPASFM